MLKTEIQIVVQKGEIYFAFRSLYLYSVTHAIRYRIDYYEFILSRT